MADNTKFVAALMALDQHLTGAKVERVEHNARSQGALLSNPWDLAYGRPYYLSDGGYSRVTWDFDSEDLWLDDTSRGQVKDAWSTELGRALRNEVEHELSKLLAAVI